ncbi:MAG: flagellar type III secretion system pore protein FliP [Tissierellia bacterium]|nr:flagellar type III secretion system pore protein FliP [Tissierellia bacterium]
MKTKVKVLVLATILILVLTEFVNAQPEVPFFEGIIGNTPEDYVFSLRLLIVLTILTLAPSILIMMTSFTRIIIVLSFIRNALGMQQTPPNQVIIGLALFLTFFIMTPVAQEINANAIQPYTNEEINFSEALDRAMEPIRKFMFKQTRNKDLALFLNISNLEEINGIEDVPNNVLIPAFIISELKTAFQIGFVIYIPFLIIDMVVSSTLMSMGMMMLPPVIISLPFKILLFVLVDGWNLITKSLILGFN